MTIDYSRRRALKLSSAIGLALLSPRLLQASTGDLDQLDSLAQAALVRSGDISALELTESAIRRIEQLNGKLNAVITPTFESALERARNGLPQGPFTGVPYLFKDLMDYKGHRTAYGSRATLKHISDQTHVFGKQAIAAGLNILGKTNTPELGLLATTEPLAFGPTRNPWDLSRSSGGSSGGAAAAVASGMVPSAQGSDGGGSLRVPSSCCGIFALKVSRGRNVAATPPSPWTLSVKGHMTRSVRDSAALYALTEATQKSARYPTIGVVDAPLARKLRIGLVMAGINGKTPSPDVDKAIGETAKLCESLGHHVIETTFPLDGERLKEAFIAIWSSHAASFKANLDRQMGKPAGADILEPWTLYMDDYFKRQGEAYTETARAYFSEIENNLDRMMDGFDVLLSPVCSTAAPKLGTQGPLVPGDQLIEDAMGYVNYTPVYNISGQPAMSVPLGWNSQDLPIGSQFAARKGDERTLFELAYQLEKARPWHQRWAPHSIARTT